MQWLSSDLSLQYNFVVSCILIVPQKLMLTSIEDEFGVNEAFHIKFNNFINIGSDLIWQSIIESCSLYLQDFDDLMTVIRKHGFSEEYERNKTAIVYYCRTGKSRTTLALAVTGLVMCHLRVKHHLKCIYRCNTIWSNFDFYENEERIFEIIV